MQVDRQAAGERGTGDKAGRQGQAGRQAGKEEGIQVGRQAGRHAGR